MNLWMKSLYIYIVCVCIIYVEELLFVYDVIHSTHKENGQNNCYPEDLNTGI